MIRTVIISVLGALTALLALASFHDVHCHTNGVCHSHPHSDIGHSHGANGEVIEP